MFKITQSGDGFCFKFLGLLLKMELPLANNMLITFAKIVFIALELNTAAADAGICKNIFGSKSSNLETTTLVCANEDTEDIMKVVKSPEHSSF